ncbi:MAG: hypothetical protein OXF88_06560 [Rhodobacteraceae bacterium]|nr:hypothetical protein [Paracoccaceae bacterium]MCY4137430.1 hypothetical protein [Paracoccaceae bacterium]
MLNRLGLNETAASRRKRQQLDHLLTVTAPHELIVLAGIAFLLLSLLAWSLFGRIENGFTTDCVLIEPGDRHHVVATEVGHLLEYLVAPGDRVEAGAPIARQSIPGLAREVAALRDRVDLLEQEALRAADSGIALASTLASTRAEAMKMEALRSVRETIVTQSSGEVTALNSKPGGHLFAGAPIARIRGEPGAEDGPMHAVARLDSRMAQLLEPGLPASVEVPMRDGKTLTMLGVLMSVTAGPLPGWVEELLPVDDGAAHRIDVALEAAPGPPVEDGAACRVGIVLGRIPPVALLDAGRF